MHTLLNRFCEEFVRIVRPLRNPLDMTAEAIDAAADGTPGREIHSEFLDLRSQFDLLADKVAEQQAYVLIFGPLKSGKSTLMNAICASYVSEVSSLPAYPCMVFVSHSTVREYTVTDYTGKTRTFADPIALQRHVDQAHRELASRIRKAEQEQHDFDPQRHFPEAIRRVDVKVPAGDLAQSSAVLVDTPGLYSRMKFGYDRMTRDFRNAAACAVFVV
ncbi:MAG: dynamin family protein, partial [Planctomycetota bacterium]